MTDVTTDQLWGELRSLCSMPLDENAQNAYGASVSPDAARAVEVVDLLSKFPEGLREDARRYARKACQRTGVDGDLFDVAVRFDQTSYDGVINSRYFRAVRDGYLGQVYTNDYHGRIDAFYYEDGVLYQTRDSYGSCSYCCAFEAANMSGRADQVLQAFLLRGMCEVISEDAHPDDVKHLVEMEHDSFVRQHGEYYDVRSHYTDESWNFSLEFEDFEEDDPEEEEEDAFLDLYEEYADYDY